jgi:hypothetical protein
MAWRPLVSDVKQQLELPPQSQSRISTSPTSPAPSFFNLSLPAPRPYDSRATRMADSMEGVVAEGEQPKTENVEQKAIAGT